MKIKTNVKAGGRKIYNHNETLMRDTAMAKAPKVKTGLRAGGVQLNHNETVVCDTAKSKAPKVKTGLRAGGSRLYNHNETLVRVR